MVHAYTQLYELYNIICQHAGVKRCHYITTCSNVTDVRIGRVIYKRKSISGGVGHGQ